MTDNRAMHDFDDAVKWWLESAESAAALRLNELLQKEFNKYQLLQMEGKCPRMVMPQNRLSLYQSVRMKNRCPRKITQTNRSIRRQLPAENALSQAIKRQR